MREGMREGRVGWGRSSSFISHTAYLDFCLFHLSIRLLLIVTDIHMSFYRL